jgi:hypothetical protein
VDKSLLAWNCAKPVALSGFLEDFAPDGDGVFKGASGKTYIESIDNCMVGCIIQSSQSQI